VINNIYLQEGGRERFFLVTQQLSSSASSLTGGMNSLSITLPDVNNGVQNAIQDCIADQI